MQDDDRRYLLTGSKPLVSGVSVQHKLALCRGVAMTVGPCLLTGGGDHERSCELPHLCCTQGASIYVSFASQCFELPGQLVELLHWILHSPGGHKLAGVPAYV